MSIVELLVAAGLATGVAFLGVYLTQKSNAVLKKVSNKVMTPTLIREEVSRAARDSGNWIAYLLQANTLSGSTLKDCLNTTGSFMCPSHDSSITDTEITSLIPPGGAVSSIDVYVPNNTQVDPSSLTNLSKDFVHIAGTVANPVYIGDFGAACSSASGTGCSSQATAYFIRQNGGVNVDPGAVKFVIKITPLVAAGSNAPAQASTYIRINVGTSWRGDTRAKAVSVGMILPFAGSETNVPSGYLLCDGRAVSATTYPQLAAVLNGAASPWGPPRSSSPPAGMFFLPDLRGAYLRGAASGTQPGVFQRQALLEHTHTTPNGALNLSAVNVSGTAPLTTTVTAHSVWLGALNSGGFPGAGGGFEYAGDPYHGLTPAPGGTATGSTSLSIPAGSNIPVSSFTPGGNFQFSGLAGPTTQITSAGAVPGEVRPPTASLHYIIRADY